MVKNKKIWADELLIGTSNKKLSGKSSSDSRLFDKYGAPEKPFNLYLSSIFTQIFDGISKKLAT